LAALRPETLSNSLTRRVQGAAFALTDELIYIPSPFLRLSPIPSSTVPLSKHSALNRDIEIYILKIDLADVASTDEAKG
jgi:hypothetical protein